MQKQRLIMGCLYLMALVLVVAWSCMSTFAQAGTLDGKTFVGQLGEKGKEKGDNDTFTFADGKFHSKACDPYGFGDAAYTTSINGDATTFETETVSSKEGKMKWAGTVKGEMLDGTVIWYKGSKAPKEYWFKGELKN